MAVLVRLDRAELLKPYAAERMDLFEVGSRVNNVKNDDEGLIEPVPP